MALMRVFEGKKILLAAPHNFSVNEMITEELRAVGFDVLGVSTPSFRYKSIWQRLHNLGRKVFFNDYENKRRLRQEAINTFYKTFAEQVSDFDFALFVRPDMFPLFFIDLLRKRGKPIIGYQWDGMQRYPQISEYVEHFDRFFVFDPVDVRKNRLPLTNFCAISKSASADDKKAKNRQAFFISSFDEMRFGQALQLRDILQKVSYNYRFIFLSGHRHLEDTIKNAGFEYIRHEISIVDTLGLVKEAEVLVDIVIPDHKGLSFRVFEALLYSKKLITTNTEVKKYDFYCPENIFVYDGTNDIEIFEFLNTPMVSISEDIQLKYGFENWIKYVLDYGEYEPITLPSV